MNLCRGKKGYHKKWEKIDFSFIATKVYQIVFLTKMNKIDGSLEGGNEIPICEGRESGRESVIAGIQPKILWKAFIWLSELPQLRTDEANRDGRRFAKKISLHSWKIPI